MLHLFIATPVKIIYDGPVESLLVPGSGGYFQVLKNHTPIIAAVTAGKLEVIDAKGARLTWAISGGLAEVFHNEATVLGDSIELASEIDVKHAEKSLKMAQKVLDDSQDEEQKSIARKELKRARNRLKIAHEIKKSNRSGN